MLNYNNWKKLNENLGSVNLGLSGTQNLGIMMDQRMSDFMPSEKEDEDMEDEDMDDEDDEDDEDMDDEDMDDEDMDDEDDEDDEDMDDEDMDDEDMDDEDMDDEDMDDEDMDDEDMDDEDMDDEDMDDEDDEDHEDDEKMNMKYGKKVRDMKDGKEGRDMDLSKCGSYMASENTMPKHIPSFKDWQKSVSSMLDNSCVTKANFDGMVNEVSLGGLQNPLNKLVDKLDASNLNKAKLLSVLRPIITACHNAVKGISDTTQKAAMMKMVKDTFIKVADEIEVPAEPAEPMPSVSKAAMMKKKMMKMKKMKKMKKK